MFIPFGSGRAGFCRLRFLDFVHCNVCRHSDRFIFTFVWSECNRDTRFGDEIFVLYGNVIDKKGGWLKLARKLWVRIKLNALAYYWTRS